MGQDIGNTGAFISMVRGFLFSGACGPRLACDVPSNSLRHRGSSFRIPGFYSDFTFQVLPMS